ncbi:MAG TPA: V-type ATPase subunit [Phycisphaerae bacterium]|nr:V-type ATPase subunit [Phycisphaerae bacterium]
MALRIALDLDYLAANVHGRRSRLAEAERLDALCRLRTVTDLARALFPESRFLTAAALQRVLILDQVEELTEIASRLGGAAGRILDWLGVRFQMENLKVLARGLAGGMALEDLRPHLILLPDDLALPVEALASAGSLEAFAALVPHEPLRDGLKRGGDLFARRPKAFFLEAGLDAGYLEELLSRARALPAADRREVLPIALQEADTFHMMLAARGKFHYGLGPEAIVPFHVRGALMARRTFEAMAAAEHVSDVAALAVGVAVDEVPAVAKEALTAADLEPLAWSRYYRLANRAFRRSHMGLGAVVAYAAIRRVELANLITLSEGIRLGQPADAIRRRLIPAAPGRGPAVQREPTRV